MPPSSKSPSPISKSSSAPRKSASSCDKFGLAPLNKSGSAKIAAASAVIGPVAGSGASTDAGAVASILEASSLNEDGYYKIGDQISVTLSFTRKVIVTGTPQITLETGSTDQVASYSSGSESVTLTFNYIVQEGDVSPDLEYVSTSALSLNGGSIKDVLDTPRVCRQLREPTETSHYICGVCYFS